MAHPSNNKRSSPKVMIWIPPPPPPKNEYYPQMKWTPLPGEKPYYPHGHAPHQEQLYTPFIIMTLYTTYHTCN